MFNAWHEEVQVMVQMRQLEIKLFQGSLTISHLSGLISNLYFTHEEEGEDCDRLLEEYDAHMLMKMDTNQTMPPLLRRRSKGLQSK